MNALITGIAAFFVAALGAVCPDEYVYVPALLTVIVVGGYVGGAIFSLQSDGVYVTVIGGFLGLNLIRVVSDRVRAEIHRQVSGQVEPLRLLDRGKLQMEERSYQEALDTFRSLASHDQTLVPIVWQGRALKRLGRVVIV